MDGSNHWAARADTLLPAALRNTQLRADDHAGHDPGDRQVRVRADRVAHPQVLIDQPGEVAALR